MRFSYFARGISKGVVTLFLGSPITAIGIPMGGVTFPFEFLMFALGTPRFGVVFLKDFLTFAVGTPRGGMRFFQGFSQSSIRKPIWLRLHFLDILCIAIAILRGGWLDTSFRPGRGSRPLS